MLPVWGATSTANCQICIPCSQMSHPSESFSSSLSPTGQQVTAVLGHQILLWETAFYYDMADDWSKNQLWNWLCRSPNCLSQYTPLSTWSSLSNFHTLSTFLWNICHWSDEPSMQTLCFMYFHFHCFCTGIPLYILKEYIFLKTVRWFWRQQDDLYLSWFFDKIISAWFAKSDFIAYSHVFQVIMKFKYIFMTN